jgi:hypothetical protein
LLEGIKDARQRFRMPMLLSRTRFHLTVGKTSSFFSARHALAGSLRWERDAHQTAPFKL